MEQFGKELEKEIGQIEMTPFLVEQIRQRIDATITLANALRIDGNYLKMA